MGRGEVGKGLREPWRRRGADRGARDCSWRRGLPRAQDYRGQVLNEYVYQAIYAILSVRESWPAIWQAGWFAHAPTRSPHSLALVAARRLARARG